MSFGAPASPDYAGAASTQYNSGVQATQAQTQANRPNQRNAAGASLEWSQDGNGNWTQTTSLDPTQQAAQTAQQQTQADRSQTAQGLNPLIAGNLSKPLDFSGVQQLDTGAQARDQAITGAYNQAASRLDPRFSQESERLNAQLAAQGLDPTSEAAQTAQGNLSREKNDAYSSAMNGAIAQGTSAGQALFNQSLQGRQQGIGEVMTQRENPLNEQNALLNGQMVGSPNFQGFDQAGAWNPVQALTAAGLQGQYNLNAQGLSNQMWGDIFSGLGQLGGSAMKAFGPGAAAAA